MSVTLKQRTCADAQGRAVPHGHLDSVQLIGPAGATVTDEQAERLGLVNGAIVEPSVEPSVEKLYHGDVEDKSGKKKRGRPRKKDR